MEAYRVVTRVSQDGDVVVKGIPLAKDSSVEVIILSPTCDDATASDLAVLTDQAEAMRFLHDMEEDVYTSSDGTPIDP